MKGRHVTAWIYSCLFCLDLARQVNAKISTYQKASTSPLVSPGDSPMSPYLQELYQQLNKERDKAKNGTTRTKRTAQVNSIESATSPINTIELAIFTDVALFSFMSGRYPGNDTKAVIMDLVLAIVNSVQDYLSLPSLGRKFRLKIVHLVIAEEGSDVPQVSGFIRTYLDNFCRWQREHSSSSSMSWDHAILLTGKDLYSWPNMDKGSSGMAFLSGMCSKYASCTISEAMSLGSTALIMAHELAHNLGVDHDGEGRNGDCDKEDFIMGPRLSPGATDWSPCSNRQIGEFLTILKSNFKDCLHHDVSKNTQEWDHQSIGLPGQRFDGHSQCHLLYGKGWKHYRGSVRGSPADTCKAIWCRKGFLLKSPNAAALQGTPCCLALQGAAQCAEDTGGCWRGECRKKEEAAEAVQDKQTTNKPTTTTQKPGAGGTSIFGRRIFFPSGQKSICSFFRQFGLDVSSMFDC